MEKQFDYIIVGAGCAGLSLAYSMSIEAFFDDKKILIVDKEQKTKQDRTWSFWDKHSNLFDEVVHHKWHYLNFFADDIMLTENVHPYVYKMIRSVDYYAFCLAKIQAKGNITFLQGDVSEMNSNASQTYIVVEGEKIHADTIFSSVLLEKMDLKPHDIYLLQHFKGWTIEVPRPFFNPDEATLMDFRVDQSNGTSFVYVLPTSPTKAMIEFTVFSEYILKDADYDAYIKDYIQHFLKISDFEVTETEFGIIPMTTYNFINQKNKLIFIGTAGGATKTSSGYTFTFIQKQTAALIEQIKHNLPLNSAIQSPRFKFYDAVLLHVLQNPNHSGAAVFSRLFRKNSFQMLFDFLHNETNLWQEIQIANTTKHLDFIKSSLAIIWGRIKYTYKSN